MDSRDERETLFRAIAENFEAIDGILDEEIQENLDRSRAGRPGESDRSGGHGGRYRRGRHLAGDLPARPDTGLPRADF